MDQPETPQQALTLAVNRLGSQSAMARLCGVSQTAVWKWLNEEMVLPAEHVLRVEAATHVARHDLRPDLYPRGLQDGVPFSPAGIGELGEHASNATEEWPLSPPDDSTAENGDKVFQAGRTR